MSSTIKVKKRRPFSAIPDDVLEDTRMRTETRLILGWLLGRPEGWTIYVSHVQRTLGVSRPRWAKARREMEALGYLSQSKYQDEEGKFHWEHIVSDVPALEFKSIVSKSNDGLPSDGKVGNKTTSPKQKNGNTPLNPPGRISLECYENARQRFPGYDVDYLERYWLGWSASQISEVINPDKAFLAWAAKYVKRNPLN